MAIALSASAQKYSEGVSGDTVVVSDSVSGNNRVAIFTLHRYAGTGGEPPACDTITYDGVSMLPALADQYTDTHVRISVYALAAFNLGASKNVVWTTSYANYAMWGAIQTFNATRSWRAAAGGLGNDTTPTLTAGSMVDGELFVAAMSTKGQAITPAGGQTTIWNDAWYAGTFTKAGVGSVTISGTIGSNYWTIGGLVLIPVISGGQVIMVMAERWKGFLRDLRAGLVPSDMLRRTYRELVQI